MVQKMANEKRLIDANALENLIRTDAKVKTDDTEHDIGRVHGLINAADIIHHAQTVEAVEVVHGKWEKAEYHGFLRCDQCKDVYINEEWLEDGKWNYCPNCGAKMDGD